MVIADQFHLSGAWNFRDLGGLVAVDGRTTKPGTVFRSSELCSLDPGGQAALLELGVTDVVDLRGGHEIAYNGVDSLPAGVTLHSAPIQDRGAGGSAPHEPRSLTPDTAEAALEHAFSRFPVIEGGRTALVRTMRVVADSTGGVLIHCAAGKDRAGWIAAALLRAVGVRAADILTDYLRSNEAVAPLRTVVLARHGDLSQVSDKVLGADAAFLDAAWSAVDRGYGGFDHYLEAIGADADLLVRLRTRMLG